MLSLMVMIVCFTYRNNLIVLPYVLQRYTIDIAMVLHLSSNSDNFGAYFCLFGFAVHFISENLNSRPWGL